MRANSGSQGGEPLLFTFYPNVGLNLLLFRLPQLSDGWDISSPTKDGTHAFCRGGM